MSEFDNKRFDELAAFLAIVQSGSIAGAGRMLQKHSTVVSKRLTALEERLGSRLIERTTRQIKLTTAGSRLAGQVRTAFEAIEQAESEASSTASEIKGHLRVALPGTMGRLWLAPLIPEFLSIHPSMSLEVDYNDRYMDLVGEGYGVAVRAGTLKDSSLIAKRLCVHRRALASSPDYLKRCGLPSAPRDLASHSCLVFSGFNSHPGWHFTRGKDRERVAVSGRLISNDSQSLLAAARDGLGIVAAGEWLFAEDFRKGTLVPVLSDWTFDADGAIFIVRPSATFTPARTEAFVQWISEVFSNGPPWEKQGRG